MFHELTANETNLVDKWRWLVGRDVVPIGWSDSGDLFLSAPDGSVQQLDTGAGAVNTLAGSRAEFDELLADEKASESILLASVVRAYEAANGPVPHGRCLGFRFLPAFEGPSGSYLAPNRILLSPHEHFESTGDLHRKIAGARRRRLGPLALLGASIMLLETAWGSFASFGLDLGRLDDFLLALSLVLPFPMYLIDLWIGRRVALCLIALFLFRWAVSGLLLGSGPVPPWSHNGLLLVAFALLQVSRVRIRGRRPVSTTLDRVLVEMMER